MKRINNIYHHITDIRNILIIYNKDIRITTKNKQKIERFEHFLVENIALIKTVLANKSYLPGKYNLFLVREPKLRLIMSQKIGDKTINHLVARYFLVNVFDNKLIYQNIATRLNKGTHFGLKLTKKYFNQIKDKYDSIYILKGDIKKYFYSINHHILKNKLRKKIKDQNALKILFDIIDTTNEPYINKEINKLKRKELQKVYNSKMKEKEKEIKIKEINNIPLYKKGKGIPIGNMTSQILALIYLNDLDHFIKEELKIKHYIRYMDDFILIHYDKKYLGKCLKIIEEKLKKEYKLFLNEKTKIVNIKNGLDFLGFRFYIGKGKVFLKLRNRTKKAFKKKIRKLKKLYNHKLITIKEIKQITSSYKGHLRYGQTYHLTKKVLEGIDDTGSFNKTDIINIGKEVNLINDN